MYTEPRLASSELGPIELFRERLSIVLRRLRIFGQQNKLRADRSKGRETWA